MLRVYQKFTLIASFKIRRHFDYVFLLCRLYSQLFSRNVATVVVTGTLSVNKQMLFCLF